MRVTKKYFYSDIFLPTVTNLNFFHASLSLPKRCRVLHLNTMFKQVVTKTIGKKELKLFPPFFLRVVEQFFVVVEWESYELGMKVKLVGLQVLCGLISIHGHKPKQQKLLYVSALRKESQRKNELFLSGSRKRKTFVLKIVRNMLS